MLVLSRKRISLIVITLSLSIFVFMLSTSENKNFKTVETVSLPVSGKTVIIDAGHGTPDE